MIFGIAITVILAWWVRTILKKGNTELKDSQTNNQVNTAIPQYKYQ